MIQRWVLYHPTEIVEEFDWSNDFIDTANWLTNIVATVAATKAFDKLYAGWLKYQEKRKKMTDKDTIPHANDLREERRILREAKLREIEKAIAARLRLNPKMPISHTFHTLEDFEHFEQLLRARGYYTRKAADPKNESREKGPVMVIDLEPEVDICPEPRKGHR